MNINYAASKSIIKKASIHHQEKSCQLLRKVVKSALKGMIVEGGAVERTDIEEDFI